MTTGLLPEKDYKHPENNETVEYFGEIWAISSNESSKLRHLQILDYISKRYDYLTQEEHNKIDYFIDIIHD